MIIVDIKFFYNFDTHKDVIYIIKTIFTTIYLGICTQKRKCTSNIFCITCTYDLTTAGPVYFYDKYMAFNFKIT